MTVARRPGRLLITAGPTHEPIDAVRYLANRSSGRLGEALARAGARRGWSVTLLLGPVGRPVEDTGADLIRFTTTADLDRLLAERATACDVLVMAAAVADYRPARPAGGKIPRSDGPITLALEPTPDLVAREARRRRPGQVFVGFSLGPRPGLLETARAKLRAKSLDSIVANPIETMDADTIEATLIRAVGAQESTPGRLSKADFADWLLDRVLPGGAEDRPATTR